jgi:hypothetical protein
VRTDQAAQATKKMADRKLQTEPPKLVLKVLDEKAVQAEPQLLLLNALEEINESDIVESAQMVDKQQQTDPPEPCHRMCSKQFKGLEHKVNQLKDALEATRNGSLDLQRQINSYKLYQNVSHAGLQMVRREQQEQIERDQRLAHKELPRAKQLLQEADAKIKRQAQELARFRKMEQDLPILSQEQPLQQASYERQVHSQNQNGSG